jgi:glycosyltransferase involved in cell wall biosynthesis
LKQVKILQVIQKPQRRGAEIFALQLSERFIQEGHQVRKVYLYPAPEHNSLPLQDGDFVIGTNEHHLFEKFPGWNPKLLSKLQSIVSQFEPDVIQINAARTLKYGALLRWKNRNSSWILIYRNIGDPTVWIQSRFRRWIFRFLILSRIDGIVAVSSRSLEWFSKNNNLSGRIIQIPRGVNPQTFVPRRSREVVREHLSTPASAKVLISVGNLSPEKRLDRFLRVIQRQITDNNNLRVWIVGDGVLRNELEAYAHKLGIDWCVLFLGSQEDVASLYHAADLHVLTSDTEGIPGVVLEAALAGLPSVATRVGGVMDCILDGKTGLLINPDDENGFAKAIAELLRDSEKRKAMGEAARNWVVDKFSIEKISAKYLIFYNELLRNRSIVTVGLPNHESFRGKI